MIAAPNKLSHTFYKRTKLVFTEPMAEFINTIDFPSSFQGTYIEQFNFDTLMLPLVNIDKLRQFLNLFSGIKTFFLIISQDVLPDKKAIFEELMEII